MPDMKTETNPIREVSFSAHRRTSSIGRLTSLYFRDPTFGSNSWKHECPHVVYRDEYYYLFRTENYYEAKTHVYRSEDPTDFGKDAASAQANYVGLIACAAPEIYEVDRVEYLSSNHDPAGGTMMCRLKWEEI